MSYSSAAIVDDELFLDKPYREPSLDDTYSGKSFEGMHDSKFHLDLQVETKLKFPKLTWIKSNHLLSKKSWEGVVVSVENGVVTARIHPRNVANQQLVDEIEFDLQQITKGDQKLVVENALFYLSIGMSRVAGGVPQSTVSIVFRRQPLWTSSELAKRDAKADELMEIMNSVD